MRRDWFTRDWDDLTIGEHLAAVIAIGYLAIAFTLAAVVSCIWDDDDL